MRQVELGSRGEQTFAIELLDGGSIGGMEDVTIKRLAGANQPAAAIRAGADGGGAVFFETQNIHRVHVCSDPSARAWEDNPDNNGLLVQGDSSLAPSWTTPESPVAYAGTGTTGVETFPFDAPLASGLQAGYDDIVLGGTCD
jgi:hypothetical protein